MRSRLVLSVSLMAFAVFGAYGWAADAARPKAYPITLSADDVREFAPLQIKYAGLQLSSASAAGIPIRVEPGVTGVMLIGNGTFRFAPDGEKPIEGNFRAAMLRFHPKDREQILPWDKLPATKDRAVYEISNRLLKESFRRCWHSGADALIPDEGSLAVVLFSREHGELLISIAKKSTVVFNFSDQKKLHQTKATESEPAALLQPMNGEAVAGSLRPSVAAGGLSWQAANSTTPENYDLSAVNFVRFPPRADVPRPASEYCFELAGGDIVFGSIIELNETRAVLDLAQFGRRAVPRSQIQQIHRQGPGTGLIYAGPNGLADWKMASPGTEWREERGLVFAEHGSGWLVGDLAIPARALIEIEISWKENPKFGVALGVDPKSGDFDRAFRLDVWDQALIVLRELAHNADVAPVEHLAAGPGRVRLSICLDQVAGRCLVYSDAGELRAELKVHEANVPVLSGLRLSNDRSHVRLERLKIAHWNGAPLDKAPLDRPHLQIQDGSIIEGRLVRYDASAGEFVVAGENGEVKVAAGSVAGVFLGAAVDRELRAVALIFQNGTRISADLVKIEKVDDGALWLSGTALGDGLRVPLAELRSLIVLRHEAK